VSQDSPSQVPAKVPGPCPGRTGNISVVNVPFQTCVRGWALATVTAVAVALAALPANADSGKWHTYAGACDGIGADVMPVVGDGPFAPYFLSGNRTLTPYSVVYHFLGSGDPGTLKARHNVVNGVPLVKPGPVPSNLTTCEIVGAFTEDGVLWEFTATVKGVVHEPMGVSRPA
jgi:hypothetical protein